MNADDTSTTPHGAAERFAAAVDGGVVHGGDPELARELEIVERLAGQRSALDPDPETRARARRRLMAALAGARAPPDRARRTPVPGPSTEPGGQLDRERAVVSSVPGN